MSHLSPGVLVALAVVAALIIGSYWLAQRQHRSAAPRRRRTAPLRGIARDHSAPPLSAAQAKAKVVSLLSSGAGWPQILLGVNPSNDPSLHAELQRIRGPHMFAPVLALQVIHHGCEEALRVNKQASALAALTAARLSMEKVTRYGD